MATSDADTTRREFGDAVTMTAGELEEWPATEEPQAAGRKKGGSGESTGHESGRRIVELLNTKKADLADDDPAHLRKVHGYVQRHLAQEPRHEDVETFNWRYSLMKRGHGPLQDADR